MNYIDIIIVILLIFAGINGFRKGFVVELASLVALVLGIWGAFEFSDIATGFLVDHFNFHSKHLKLVSFILTFVVIVILVHIIGSVVNKMVETVMLGLVNRLAGIVFGILKSLLFLSVFLVIFDRIDNDVTLISKEKKAESKLYKPVRNFVPGIFPFVEDWIGTDSNEGKNTSEEPSV